VTTNKAANWLILVVEDIEETRDGIEKLLKAEGYRVEPARSPDDAIERAKRQLPDLLLVSLAGSTEEIIQSARQIRHGAELKEHIPIVIFCIKEVPEGEEVAVEGNIYLTRPDNFNQLRALIRRLLDK
jgi:DNA-binding response OmpR family regulator